MSTNTILLGKNLTLEEAAETLVGKEVLITHESGFEKSMVVGEVLPPDPDGERGELYSLKAKDRKIVFFIYPKTQITFLD